MNFKKALFVASMGWCFTPWMSSSIALVLGISLAMTLGNPFLEKTQKATSQLLAIAIVGLGCGMNLQTVARVGIEGIGYTITGIVLTLFLGFFLGKLFKVPRDTSLLISTGTAICGGSAIAAVASAIRPKNEEVTISLATVFCLNAIGLILFPPLGHWFGLDQNQFGLWSALAIHDTSSVVGSTLQYGELALKVGTTVKLARALWIVPLTILVAWKYSKDKPGKMKKPWFILGFLGTATLMTYLPALNELGHGIEWVAKRLMVLTLFLIGANLNQKTLKAVGLRPLLMGLMLWGGVGTAVLLAIMVGIIT